MAAWLSRSTLAPELSPPWTGVLEQVTALAGVYLLDLLLLYYHFSLYSSTFYRNTS